MANLKFAADTTVAKATKSEKLDWQPLTREELPPALQAKWDAAEAAHVVAREAEADLQNALNASLKKAKSLPDGKVLLLAFKKRYDSVAVALADVKSAASKRTSGLTFR